MRCRNHSRATKIGQRTWKRKALCSNGVPCRSRIRKRIRPSSASSSSSLRRANDTRAAFATDRSLAIASSSRTKPWSRTGIESGITPVMTATPRSLETAHVGSSGWAYPEWRGSFYPADAQPPDFLRLYAERLNAVELNATYYRLPSEEQFATWAAQVPTGFRFAVKLSRQVVEGGRLDRLGTFAERVAVLGERLGPLLVQLPEERPRDEGTLRLLLDSLPPELEVALEFKHPSWEGVDVPVLVNAWDERQPFVYLRVTDTSDLERLAARIRADGRRVYCFVNRGDAVDHSPGGEPTAAAAVRLSTLLA